ncbi:MAG: GntR family transcriptional regulator [Microbacterium sp.]|uniref:GntR family transcriptional regulator n=1 Tax=Microbacterium sp. TaxID=51671 RepID=UPI001AD5807E|nr:GntR family transcriptional regulator [Microbacterium sp.]MBN9155791.1 GntR family transcriptional regulator [Microbacterium sp.]MBN9173197.1 GntR family transcriptional regulator [Microbacterium sp.]
MRATPTQNRRDAIVVDELRRLVLGPTMAPGRRLVESALAESLGTSRARVRSALERLAGEDLVELRLNRSAIVKGIGAREALEALDVSKSLEALVVMLAVHRRTSGDVDELGARLLELGKAIAAGDSVTVDGREEELYAAIVDTARHEVAKKTLIGLRARLAHVNRDVNRDAGYLNRRHFAYVELVDAIRSADAERGREAMIRVASGTRDLLVDRLRSRV